MAETTKSASGSTKGAKVAPAIALIADEDHPDFVGGLLGDASGSAPVEALTPNPDGPIPLPPLPGPLPIPIPVPRWPRPEPFPAPIPLPHPFPFPICGLVSGRYQKINVPFPPIWPTPWRPNQPPLTPFPSLPVNLFTLTVRVDVDRYYPQNRISIEATRLFPHRAGHVIAEVISDQCLGYNHREIIATITYRDGDANLIPGTTVTFSARRGRGFSYASYSVTLSGGITPVTHDLAFKSIYFDPVEFEIDTVENAGTATTTYDTASHPNRPAALPAETISLGTVYQRAGFDVSISPNASTIPIADAGANGTWSDSEMHNAMVTYWSRFANNPNWALWVLFAARHDQGRSLGGVMFDDIGPNHRQGTAIFTDSFIQDAPAGDPAAAAWRNRMVFWTATHEMGHAFNLAHSWQKSLGAPYGNPWVPLADEPEARSFMNYPYNVSGGQAAFFADFAFRFSDSELLFMRHAPRRFVQMGNENWFTNHAFEDGLALPKSGRYQLALRPNRAENSYRFLEPVTMELKLTNRSGADMVLDGDMLADGRHVSICIQREGGLSKQWRPMITRCHEIHPQTVAPDASIYGAHLISADTSGWLIDEPGFYKLQAAVNMGDEVVVSNVVRLWVQPSRSTEEGKIAGDFFTEDVGRVLAFSGAPELAAAETTLRELAGRCPDNPAAVAATVALTAPELRPYKSLAVTDKDRMQIVAASAKPVSAAKTIAKELLAKSDQAANMMGHIPYFGQLRTVAETMETSGDEAGAVKVMEETIAVMKKREILPAVIDQAEKRLKRRR